MDGADEQKAAQLKGHPGNDRTQARDPQHSRQDKHAHASQTELEHDKHAKSAPQGQDIENDAQRIKRRMLTIGQKWLTGKKKRVPEGELARLNGLDDKTLPGVILQDQIAQQRIVRLTDAQFLGCRKIRLKSKQIVDGQQGACAQCHRQKENEGEQKQSQQRPG